MTKLDSLSAIATWLGDILKDLVAGIRNTYFYWRHRQDGLEDLAE